MVLRLVYVKGLQRMVVIMEEEEFLKDGLNVLMVLKLGLKNELKSGLLESLEEGMRLG